jgi:hypothetical protein
MVATPVIHRLHGVADTDPYPLIASAKSIRRFEPLD